MHHLLVIREVLFSSSSDSFLRKELMASFWLWVCCVSSHTFSPHHTLLVMLLSLANLDPLANLSYFHLTWVESDTLRAVKFWSSECCSPLRFLHATVVPGMGSTQECFPQCVTGIPVHL
jgi:hypothetical protein